MTIKELTDKLLVELDRSLIVDKKTKSFWIKNSQSMPTSAVLFFYKQLVQTNAHIDFMINIGLDANPALLEKIIYKSKTAKKKAYKYLETQVAEEENPDAFLNSSLK